MNLTKDIFKTEEEAINFLTFNGYTDNATKHFGSSCKCACGETSSLFYINPVTKEGHRVGICETCGQE